MVHIKKKKKKRERLKEKNDTIQIEFCVNACDGHQSFSWPKIKYTDYFTDQKKQGWS